MTDKPTLRGWYECQTVACTSRIVRYWDGKYLRDSSSDMLGVCHIEEYHSFRGPLIDDHPAAKALAFLLVKLAMRELDAALIRKTCEEALAKCKGEPDAKESSNA
jgi:hypothetical protein